jgi:hypothetical protein
MNRPLVLLALAATAGACAAAADRPRTNLVAVVTDD